MIVKSKRALSLVLSVMLLVTACLPGLVLPTAAADTAPDGLLPFGDFEGTPTDGWTWATRPANEIKTYSIISTEYGKAQVTTDLSDSSNHCLMFAPSESGAAYNGYYKAAPVVAGKKYRLSMRYKGTGLRVYLEKTNCTPNGQFNPPTANEWTTHEVVFTVNETMTNRNFIFNFGHVGGTGTAYLDDVCLNEVIDLAGISISSKQITMAKGTTHKLALTAQPDGAFLPSGSVEWTSSNTAAATVSADGTVTAVAPGVTYITATLSGYTATATVIVDPYAPVLLGDFEDDILSGWKYSDASYSILHDKSPMKLHPESNGNHCLYIPATGTDDGTGTITYKAYSRYYNKLPVEGNKTYQLRFRYKGDGVAVRKSSSGAATSLPSVSDWTTYSLEFTTAANPSTSYIFGVGHQAKAGDGYIDDVTLTEVSPFKELLVDGDLQSNSLASNWSKFTAATANVTHTTDPADSANRCFKFTGSRVPNYSKISSAKNSTYYLFSFRHKGTGKAQVSFTKSYVDVDSVVVLNTEKYTVGNTTNDIRLYFDTQADWQTINIVFKTTAATSKDWILQFGSNGSSTEIYLDDFSLIELGGAYAQEGLAGGSVSVSNGTDSGVLLSGLLGKTVTVTVTPDEGYLLVPGSLRYITTDGVTKRILNKDATTFGTGAGNAFAFDMPINNVRILADFVKADETDFAWGTVGTSVHLAGDGVTTDGIRFLTRVNMAAFDATTSGYSLKYEGETYTVKELGLMLKRADNTNELTVENKEAYGMSHLPSTDRIWSVAVYSDTTNTFRLTDYTESYIDYTIAMTTSIPSETFNDRLYTARGYIVLEKGGEEIVVYASERTDSVNTTIARENGELSDTDIIVPGIGGGDGGSDEEDEPTVNVPADDKDYSNADLKILSIGNSFSQDAQGYLAKIAEAEGKTFKTVNLYKSGCALQTHYEGWVDNEAIYTYELNGVANNTSAVTLKAVLESDQFDVITLQESSWRSMSYSNFQPYLNNLITAIRELQPNAKIYIHQVWAYGDGHAEHVSRPAITGGTMEAMFAKTEAAYNAAAAATGLSLIPSGQAIMNAQTELNKGGYGVTSIQRDNSHVSKTWGRYLLARLWYEMFTGEVPNVTINQVNASVANDAAMEAMIQGAIADAFAEYPADPVEMEAAA